ncbi:AAA family ATPase [Sphingomonas sp. A2-49]|uniref:TrlF family AAA-like ATPase n=1 Tax=Sphingomonas sp. A2-49 TaxID=1391375 RepID=UPI0021D11C98|nr:AAA family ATPase [Sphingomonas sp. A2-49]MCU6453936.1 AAA family ATPase [Sphingomonas sp. A2-49]
MAHEIGFHPGTVWHRIDAQCHTPRDRSWVGGPGLAGGTQEQEAARQKWAEEFVHAALARQLSIIAVTDHHDVAMIPYVMQAAHALATPRELIVLPGIEITCSDGVQCLALFGPETTQQEWTRVLAKLPAVEAASLEDEKTCETAHCGLTVADLMNSVQTDDVLRDRVILIPHFGNEGAHKSLNAPSQAPRAKALLSDGVYIETAFPSLDATTLDKIQGRIEEWGTRRRAVLATGDNKRASWDRLGAHECWIKLGEPNMEGFRQAFLADEARLAYAEPDRPSARILSIEVSSSLTGANPLSCIFNDGFNSVIGGRGSGKSSLLEYLRFGLGRAELDIYGEDGERRTLREREAQLVEQTLNGGFVKVVLDREGVIETWRRSGNQPDQIEVRVGKNDPETVTIAEAQRRFPARAFHQKELSTTMVDAAAAADNITGIAAAEVIGERRRIDQEIANARREMATALQGAAARWQFQFELDEASRRVADIRRRLEALTQRLHDGGVQKQDLDTLAEAPRYGSARNYLDEVGRRIVVDREALGELVKSHLAIDLGRHGDAIGFPHLSSLCGAIADARAEALSAVRGILTGLEAVEVKRQRAIEAFDVDFGDFQARYDAAKGRQNEHKFLIADAERLTAELREATALEDVASEKAKRAEPNIARLGLTRKKLADLLVTRSDLLARTAAEVVDKSEGSLKARVKRDRLPSEAVEALCAVLEGSRFRDPEQHCSDWVGAIMHAGGPGWSQAAEGMLDIYRTKILAGSPVLPGKDAIAALSAAMFDGKNKLTDLQAVRVYQNLSDHAVAAILSATPRDTIALTYVSDGRDIPFNMASPGQQASALLRLLLRQSAGTLIIDQPEDDLDNRVMMSIVRLIRTSKSRRQIIFATHNSNLVVNGDADKVIVMSANRTEGRLKIGTATISIICDGAIETPAVRDAITHVMEGGLEAFNLRARKYKFQQSIG